MPALNNIQKEIFSVWKIPLKRGLGTNRPKINLKIDLCKFSIKMWLKFQLNQRTSLNINKNVNIFLLFMFLPPHHSYLFHKTNFAIRIF